MWFFVEIKSFVLEKNDRNFAANLQKLNKISYNERTLSSKGVVIISSLWELTDEKLIEAYHKATLLKLDDTFIEMLESELSARGLENTIRLCVS